MMLLPSRQITSVAAVAGAAGVPGGAEAAAFLARTSGLDATHTNAYAALIDGLVTDGVWSKLDMLHVYATQDTTTAKLNLIGNIYNGTTPGTPTFTADRGYTPVGGTDAIHTGFIPSTASSPQFTRNSAHVSTWSLTNQTTSSGLVMGATTAGNANIVGMHARFNDGNSYYYVNSTGGGNVTNSSSIGHFLGNRSSSTDLQGYKNGSSVLTSTSNNSAAVGARELATVGQNQDGTYIAAIAAGGYQIAMASIGSSLNSTEAGNFYTRLRTYMTAVGVP